MNKPFETSLEIIALKCQISIKFDQIIEGLSAKPCHAIVKSLHHPSPGFAKSPVRPVHCRDPLVLRRSLIHDLRGPIG